MPCNARLILLIKSEAGVLLVLGMPVELGMSWMCCTTGGSKRLGELFQSLTFSPSRQVPDNTVSFVPSLLK